MEFFAWSNIFIKGNTLWVGNENTKQRMNNLKPNENGDGNGITETSRKSTKRECNDIIRRVRNCPDCQSEIEYGSKDAYYAGLKRNGRCKKCQQCGKKVSKETGLKISRSKRGKPGHPHTKEHRKKIQGRGNAMYGVHRYGELNPFHGKCHTEEARRKMRVAACKRVMKLQRNNAGRINNVGIKEGRYFDRLEKEHGWKGIYYKKSKKQFLIEYLGYFVDYYEPNLNIVVEYDEPRHYRHGVLIEKDVKRMNEIKRYLGCQFWRYDEYKKWIKRF